MRSTVAEEHGGKSGNLVAEERGGKAGSSVFKAAGVRAESAAVRPTLPMLMPRHLALLPCARPQWFEDTAELARRLPALRRELAFLERGAARLRVHRIETLAAALREFYAEVSESVAYAVGRDGVGSAQPSDPPAQLLVRAHQRLRAMLNQAAAWQEVNPASETAAALLDWVACRRAANRLESDPLSPLTLRARIHGFAALLCEVLDRQVHLSFVCARAALDEAALRAAQRGAQALLRLALVSSRESPWRRRAAGRTAAVNLDLRLEARGTRLTVVLEADHEAPNPDAPRIVRRHAGRARLSVESKGGRCRYRLLLRPARGARLATGREEERASRSEARDRSEAP